MTTGITILAAFLGAWATVPVVGRFGALVGAIDQPNSDVRTHKQPTPLLGGIPIMLGTLIPFVWLNPLRLTTAAIVPMALLLGMSAFKDISRRDLSPWLQLVVQFVACWLALDAYAEAVPNGVMRIVFVVGGVALINAINFLDVMDGLCSMVAALIAMAIYVITGQLLALTLAAACCGFWVWNRPRARIFMGDTGSYFLGLSLFLLVANGVAGGSPLLLIVVIVPAAEMAGTIAIRNIRSRPLTKGDSSHPSLCLLNSGRSPWTVLATYSAAAASTCVLAWTILRT